MLLIFNNTNIADIGDAVGLRGSATAGNLYWALYTADPGETGTAPTSETAYTGYARVAAARSGASLVVTGNSVSPAADVTFGECTASPGGAITHAGIVNTASGAGKLLYKGTFTPNVTMAERRGAQCWHLAAVARVFLLAKAGLFRFCLLMACLRLMLWPAQKQMVCCLVLAWRWYQWTAELWHGRCCPQQQVASF